MKIKRQGALIVLVIGIFILPQIAFASWWNPFSWDIFSFFHDSPTRERTVASSTPPEAATTPITSSEIMDTSLASSDPATYKSSDATLTKPAAIRKCPSVSCEAMRYYSETARVHVVGENTNWYQIESWDDNGSKLRGWMIKQAFQTTKVASPQTRTPGDANAPQKQPPVLPNPSLAQTTVTSWVDLENKYFAEDKTKGWTSLTLTNELGEKHYYRLENGVYMQKATPEETQQPFIPAPPANTTLCNGTYYSSCSVGSDLVCPSNGESAYCQTQKKTYFENGEYVSLTDSEHNALLQQKHITLQKLQDQIQTLINHSQKLIADSQVGCTDMTITLQQGKGAVGAWAHGQECAAASEYAINSAKLDSIQIQGIQEQVRQIQQNYQ